MTTNDQYRNDQYANDELRQEQYGHDVPPPPPPPQEDPYEGRDAEYREPTAYEEPVPAEQSTPVNQAATEHERDTGEVLFAGGDLSGFRSHWDEVQATFVDDPQQCVRQADALVSDVVEKLTTSFGTTRSRLEAQWAGGEEVSTEDLRVALTQYREFFQRLLAV